MQSKYYRIYCSIVLRAITRDFRPRYDNKIGEFERHHVLPMSLGGNRGYSNTVVLSTREHFIVHQLLPKFVVSKDAIHKMKIAAFRLANKHKGISYSAREYEAARKLSAEASSIFHKGVPKSEAAKAKNRASHMGEKNGFFGRKHSSETKKKISEKSKLRRGWRHTPESIALMSAKAKARRSN